MRAASLSGRVAALLGGLALALGAALAPWGSLPAHMVEHAVVLMIAAPLIALGGPISIALRLLPGRPARLLARLLRTRAVRALTHPATAWSLFVGVQLAFHVTPLFERALGTGWLHELEHGLFLATAILFWAPVVGTDPLPHRLEGPARAGYLLAAMPAVDVGAVWLILTNHQGAGTAMLASMMPLGLAGALAGYLWVRAEERDAAGAEPSSRATRDEPGVRRPALLAVALLCGVLSGWHFVGEAESQQRKEAGQDERASVRTASERKLAAEGRRLFAEECASCHGFDARGVRDSGPSLRGVGAASAHFYLSTGRMPLNQPGDQPLRAEPRYAPRQIDALVAYVGSFGGPPIPKVRPDRGSLSEGLEAFTNFCSGCHSISGEGGVVTGAEAPRLTEATPTQVAEAVRVGPYVMPRWDEDAIDQHTLDSIARYVKLTQNPDDRGGWGIGHIGPVPEGLVAWLLAGVALLLVVRLIGERGEI